MNNTISENIAYANLDEGIQLWFSDNNRILRNSVYNNTDEGIFLNQSNYITITHNEVKRNKGDGILLYQSSYNIISENLIKENIISGIHINESLSKDNIFFKNYFFNNTIHAQDKGLNTYWNNSLIGNYWDNYTGVDLNLDGIGDTPHNISLIPLIQDHLPIHGNPLYYGQTIHIDGKGVDSYTWVWASTRAWCMGLGISSDPYIIKDLTINGSGNDFCIYIENSNAYSIIQNCTLYNSGLYAIKLRNVSNSELIENNCSLNNDIGVMLQNCYDNILSGNVVCYNSYGIYLNHSDNNMLYQNFASDNTYGLYLDYSNRNNISQCLASNHIQDGIAIFFSNHTIVYENYVTENNMAGISFYNNINSTISLNFASNNTYGLYLRDTEDCEILDNDVINNT